MSDFGDGWFPREMWELAESGKITADEFALLLKIHNLARGPRGCWASNKTLARYVNNAEPPTTRTIQRRLRNLEAAGVVVRSVTANRRTYETIWSAALKSARPVPRKPIQKDSKRGNIPPESGMTKLSPTPRKGHDKIVTQNKRGLSLRAVPKEAVFHPPESTENNTSDFSQNRGCGLPTAGLVPEGPNYAKMLHTVLKERRKLPVGVRPKTWNRYLAPLAARHRDFAAVFNWYLANVGRPYVPQAYSASAFVAKFDKIRAAFRRTGGAGTALPDSPWLKYAMTELPPESRDVANATLHGLANIKRELKRELDRAYPDLGRYVPVRFGVSELLAEWFGEDLSCRAIFWHRRFPDTPWTAEHPEYGRWVRRYLKSLGLDSATIERIWGLHENADDSHGR